MATNPLGNSPIFKQAFRTSKPNFACMANIPLDAPADPTDIVTALSQAVRLPPSRFLPQTTRAELDESYKTFDAATMDASGLLLFQVLIVPNATNDHPPPSHYCKLLSADSDIKAVLAKLLPQLSTLKGIDAAEYRRSAPRVLDAPTLQSVNHYNATVMLRLWESGTVYAIICNATSDLLLRSRPFSAQIFKGTDPANALLGHY